VHASETGELFTTEDNFNPGLLSAGPAHTLFAQLAVQGGAKGDLMHNEFLSHFTRADSDITRAGFEVDIKAITMTDSRKGFITLRAEQWYNGTLADDRLNGMQSADEFYGYIGKVTNNTVEVRVSQLFTRTLIWFTRRPPFVCMLILHVVIFDPFNFFPSFCTWPFGGLSRGR